MIIPSPRSKKRARIEIIPLIDIMFFLLATFMMVSLTLIHNRGLPVRLPGSAAGTPQSHEESVTLTLQADGIIFFNKAQVALPELEGRLQQLYQADPQTKIFINGDTAASFGGAVKLLDTVRAAGFTRIAIETTKE
jgi:biopolymer transport protein ExbD